MVGLAVFSEPFDGHHGALRQRALPFYSTVRWFWMIPLVHSTLRTIGIRFCLNDQSWISLDR